MSDAPLISVLMANRNAAPFIGAAVRSVLGQTLGSLELILADDASTDDSVARACAAAAGDPRLIVLHASEPGGPAAARNRAFAAARGRWIAIVDSDDVLQRERLARLVSAAETDGADIAADNLLVFYQDRSRRPHFHLRGRSARGPKWIGLEEFVRSNSLNAREPALGYLKPLIRRSRMERVDGPYDESLAVAEDYDLIFRLIALGAKMRVYPDPGYFYRKHRASVSHRLDRGLVQAMLDADARFCRDRWFTPDEYGVLRARRRSLKVARAYEEVREALKQRRLGDALRICLQTPKAAALLRQPIADRLGAMLPRRTAARREPRRVVFLSRQRIVGATNGSSSYVLSLAAFLRRAGYKVSYLGISPKVFGRWPVLPLKREVGVFDDYRVRGGVRMGPFVVALDPSRLAVTLLTGLERVLARLHLTRPGWVKPAPYSVAVPATPSDLLFAARAAGPDVAGVVCDYAYLAPLAPYALAFDAPVLVLMHDLFSSRPRQFDRIGAQDTVARLDMEEELRLLSCADTVVAIQPEEADEVRPRLTDTDVVVAPMAVDVQAPQPGRGDRILFVGSNTAPNIVGLKWWLDEVWPRIRAVRPDVKVEIAGSVARGLDGAPAGVRLLGVVGRLGPLYARAGVVISPLLTGSGLKVKVIEALGAGKAVVGTRLSAQGVEDQIGDAMVIADDPAAFAEAVLSLLASRPAREDLGRRAATCARDHFGRELCYRPVLDALAARPAAAVPENAAAASA
jgi:succinoglycan biosynthesis protein ExoO